jgi:hypothetical protein
MTISSGPLSCVIPSPKLSPFRPMIGIGRGFSTPWILYRRLYYRLMKLPTAPKSIITLVSRSMMLAVIFIYTPYAVATRYYLFIL